MLPKKHRLSKSAEVKQTTARGRSFFNPFFVVKAYRDTEIVKFTVIVSTKVSKKAVVRNRLKRVIRDVVRINISKFRHGSYAVIVKPKAVAITNDEMRQQLLNTLTAGKIIQ